MRIDQLLADMQYGDAITDNALAIQSVLKKNGFESDIYAENIHPSLISKVKPLSEYKSSDVVLHHFAIGSKVNEIVKKLDNRKVLIYHNITPSAFFKGYNLKSELSCIEARGQLERNKDSYDLALAVSEYNRLELLDLGYKNTAVLPILYNISGLKKYPKASNSTNILFLGRIAPNKCQQDVISAFAKYKLRYNKGAKLYIAGSYHGMEKYLNELLNYVNFLGVDDVYFTGRLSYEQMYRLYSNTDLFLSMSEHEGFCVPLLECMAYDIPIVAYNGGAVSETLGDSGVLLYEKDFNMAASVMDEVLTNNALREQIILKQRKRLEDFSECSVSKRLIDIIKEKIV